MKSFYAAKNIISENDGVRQFNSIVRNRIDYALFENDPKTSEGFNNIIKYVMLWVGSCYGNDNKDINSYVSHLIKNRISN